MLCVILAGRRAAALGARRRSAERHGGIDEEREEWMAVAPLRCGGKERPRHPRRSPRDGLGDGVTDGLARAESHL